jgi:hypothetical protein
MAVTFPVADKILRYQIETEHGFGVFLRISESEARKEPAAIRAMLGDRLAWFVRSEFDKRPATPAAGK